MEVKDLRIGNLVYGGFEDDEENSNHSVCLVTGLSEGQHLGEGWNFMLENMERKDVENYYEMKPIELTQEWFDKFGFYKMGMWKIIKDVEFSKLIGYGLAIKGIDGYNRLNQNSILYVHQLQNLFHALTGEELTLNN